MAAPKRRKNKIDWEQIDWSRENVEIAGELGVSRELVRQHRQKLFPSPKSQKPGHVVLEPTVKRTAAMYGVPYLLARQWHQAGGLPVDRGRPKFVLPPDFVPATLEEDARRLGVHLHTVAAAMKRQGIARGKAGKKRGRAPFSLPADYVPERLESDVKRFGVCPATILNARRRMVRDNKLPAFIRAETKRRS